MQQSLLELNQIVAPQKLNREQRGYKKYDAGEDSYYVGWVGHFFFFKSFCISVFMHKNMYAHMKHTHTYTVNMNSVNQLTI